jgi:tRNA (guanine37-N1)-methyltransferase
MPHMLKQVLGNILTTDEASQVYSAFDQIGEIVIIKIPEPLAHKKVLIAQAILDNIKTAKSVFAQTSAVQGDFRVRGLEFLAGNNTTVAEYKEHGCRFKVDVAKTYFSPRLSTERKRIADMVQDNEIVVNMFAGVGTFSILIAKTNKTCIVYSIDSNRAAADLCAVNVKLNKVEDRVRSICGDAAKIIKDDLGGIADRVIMPLPERAKEYVSDAVHALKSSGGTVHYFAHVQASNRKESKVAGLEDARKAFSGYNFEVRHVQVVREVGPRLYQNVADVSITR